MQIQYFLLVLIIDIGLSNFEHQFGIEILLNIFLIFLYNIGELWENYQTDTGQTYDISQEFGLILTEFKICI